MSHFSTRFFYISILDVSATNYGLCFFKSLEFHFARSGVLPARPRLHGTGVDPTRKPGNETISAFFFGLRPAPARNEKKR